MSSRRELLENEIRFARHCERKFGKGHPETIRMKAKADMAYLALQNEKKRPDVSHIQNVTAWRRE